MPITISVSLLRPQPLRLAFAAFKKRKSPIIGFKGSERHRVERPFFYVVYKKTQPQAMKCKRRLAKASSKVKDKGKRAARAKYRAWPPWRRQFFCCDKRGGHTARSECGRAHRCIRHECPIPPAKRASLQGESRPIIGNARWGVNVNNMFFAGRIAFKMRQAGLKTDFQRTLIPRT